jgi:small subunit ribosomal protein S21
MVISVEVRGNIEKAIKVLKRKMDSEGLRRELRRRRFYEKPSVKRKRKALEARRRRQKSMRRSYR